jgi:hypothetical protein
MSGHSFHHQRKGLEMSDQTNILVDTLGHQAADLQKFDRGATTLAEVQTGLDAVENLRSDQNAALNTGAPVGRH